MNQMHEANRRDWTLADLLNPLAQSGFMLYRLRESPAKDSRFWQSHSYVPGTDDRLLDWQENPRAGLPAWLTVAAWKPVAAVAPGNQVCK